MSTEAPRNDEGHTEEELWAMLEGTQGSDRADILIQICAMLVDRSEREQALALIDTAIEEAVKVDNDLLAARATMLRGFVLRKLERHSESAESYLGAAPVFERYDELGGVSAAYFEASWSLELAQEYERALECADHAVAAAIEVDLAEEKARAYNQRGDVLQRLDRPYTEVLQALSLARQAYREACNERAVLHLDERVAHIFEQQGDYEAAANLLRDCIHVADTVNAEKAAFLSLSLGRILRLQGQYAEAVATLQKALQFHLAKQELVLLGRNYFELAQCEWRLGNEEDALLLVSKARAHLDIAGVDNGVRDADETRAVMLHGAGRYDEAITVNRQLLETSDGWVRFMARARLADNLRCQGDLQQALDMSTPEEDEDPTWVGWGGWFWRESIRAWTLETLERWDDAWDIARRCVAMDMRSASAFTRAKLLEMVGDYHYTGGEDGAEDIGAAHHWWAQAIAFYLAADSVHDAKRLSRQFLPDTAEEKVQ